MFYAGVDIGSVNDFEVANISARDDFQALANSKYFILLYPRPLPSSVLVEVGAAIAFGMPSVFLCQIESYCLSFCAKWRLD